MFDGKRNAGRKAALIARYLTSKVHFQSHARRIGIDELQSKGVEILDMRKDTKLQNAVWELHLAITLTFSMTGAYKIFENHNGESLIRQLLPR